MLLETAEHLEHLPEDREQMAIKLLPNKKKQTITSLTAYRTPVGAIDEGALLLHMFWIKLAYALARLFFLVSLSVQYVISFCQRSAINILT